MRFKIILDQPSVSSGSFVYPNTEREEHSSSNIMQCDQPSPETTLYADSLGEEGRFLSDFIQRQGNNPPLKEIILPLYNSYHGILCQKINGLNCFTLHPTVNI